MFTMTQSLPMALLVGVSMAGVALPRAQDEPARSSPVPAVQTRNPATTCSLEEVLGAPVHLASGGEEKPAEGRAEGRKGEAIGKVQDLVLLARECRAGWAVISAKSPGGGAERTVLVPISELELMTSEKRPAYSLRMQAKDFHALPPFDVRKAETEGLDKAVAATPGRAAAPDDRKDPEGDGAKARQPQKLPTHILASRLKGTAVSGSDKDFGKVSGAAIAPASNSVGYLIVSGNGQGAAAHVIPFRACQWSPAGEGDSRAAILKLERTCDQIRAAPKYERPKEGFLSSEQMSAADEFFAAARPAAHSRMPGRN